MISTITNYSQNIDTLFPVPGQDNDSQGFRDNFANIKQSLNIAATEINNLSLNTTQIVQKTVIVQGTTNGAQGSAINVSSATIRLNQDELHPERSKPAMSITGTSYLSVGNDPVGSDVSITGITGGTNPSFTVDQPDLIKIGSTFKFSDSDPTTYTVTDVNGTTVYTNSAFVPSELSVSTGTSIRMHSGKIAGSIFRDHTPPTTPLGKPGDEKGAMVITSSSVHIAHSDYDGQSPIWSKLNNSLENQQLTIVNPTTVYSDAVPNTICDLNQSARFLSNLPSSDLGVQFTNLPPIPYQVETSFIVLSPTYKIKSIWVDGAGPSARDFLVYTTATDSGGTTVINQAPASQARKYTITLISVTSGSVTVLVERMNFEAHSSNPSAWDNV
jgi:hypothetical protein